MKPLNKDILSYAIEDAIDKRIKDFENKEDKIEADLIILESLKRAEVVFRSLSIRGVSLSGLNFERFSEQIEEKSSIVFMNDDVYEKFMYFIEYKSDKYKKAKQIIEIMER